LRELHCYTLSRIRQLEFHRPRIVRAATPRDPLPAFEHAKQTAHGTFLESEPLRECVLGKHLAACQLHERVRFCHGYWLSAGRLLRSMQAKCTDKRNELFL